MSPRKPFILHPEEQVTSSTLESVRIPDDIAALLEGRSTWARQGLGVHSTAGFVHAGSRGVIALELRNDGPVPIKLYPGMRVAQLSFLMLDQDCASGYYGKDVKYSADFRPETGSPWKDYEFALFDKDERDGRDGKTGLFERILESFS
jgi:dCTP deaminase